VPYHGQNKGHAKNNPDPAKKLRNSRSRVECLPRRKLHSAKGLGP